MYIVDFEINIPYNVQYRYRYRLTENFRYRYRLTSKFRYQYRLTKVQDQYRLTSKFRYQYQLKCCYRYISNIIWYESDYNSSTDEQFSEDTTIFAIFSKSNEEKMFSSIGEKRKFDLSAIYVLRNSGHIKM